MDDHRANVLPFDVDLTRLRPLRSEDIRPPWLEPVRLTWSARHRQFKKCIGTHEGADGRVRPRIFWLGADQAEATFRARVFLEAWAILRTFGRPRWTREMEDWAKRR